MNINNYPPSNRVPGEIHRPKEHALDKDLTKLSKRELLDLKSRQLKLLENKSRLQKLPDKGKKIQDLYDRVVKALDLKSEIDATSSLLSSLHLGSNDINNIEWKDITSNGKQPDDLDSDDDDPLAIMASSNSVTKNKKIVKHLRDDECEKKLITEEDLKEAQEIASSTLHFDPVLEYACQMENMEPPHHFLLYKPKANSLNSSTSSTSEESKKKQRDNSAASPPVHSQGVKHLSIRESIEAEHVHRQKMKEVHEKQAAERLTTKAKVLGDGDGSIPSKPEITMTKYRLAASIIDESDDDAANNSLTDEDEDPLD